MFKVEQRLFWRCNLAIEWSPVRTHHGTPWQRRPLPALWCKVSFAPLGERLSFNLNDCSLISVQQHARPCREPSSSRLTVEWSPVRNLVPWHSMATSNITSSLVQQTHMPPTDENDHHYKISGTHIALAFAAEVTSTSHAVPIPSEEDFNASFTEELLKPRHVDWLTRRCTWRFRGSTSTGCLAADPLHALPLSRAQIFDFATVYVFAYPRERRGSGDVRAA